MGSPGGSSGGKAAAPSSSLRAVWACLALCLLLSRCSPCEGARKLLLDQEEGNDGKVMHFQGGLQVLRVPPPPPPPIVGGGEERRPEAAAAAVTVPRGFAAAPGGRAARLMRSVPSPGVGH